MSSRSETRKRIVYNEAAYSLAITNLILQSVGDDFPRLDAVEQLTKDLRRLPTIPLSELIELLAQGRGIMLDPDTIEKLTRKIEDEMENPPVVKS